MKIKLKGRFAPAGLQKNPTNEICTDAIVNYLVNQTPIKETIRNCKDITKFVTIRTVKGGAMWQDMYVGKAVRWYYSTNGSEITYKSNGNKVARSDGCRPLMELNEFPADLDYEWYITEAESLLEGVGR